MVMEELDAVADHDGENDLQSHDCQHQHQHQHQPQQYTSTCSSTSQEPTTSGPLLMFLSVLLRENAVLAKAASWNVTIVADNAALLPEKYSKSRNVTETRNSTARSSSMQELSRWESHVVRTPPVVAERGRERQAQASWHTSPARPQRRNSFDLDRTNDKLLGDPTSSDSCRRALSQSMSQLTTLQEGDIQHLVKKAQPPRVPVRRSSGRAHSPPPQHQVNNDESNSFHLEFSESQSYNDAEDAAVQRVVEDIQSLQVGAVVENPPNHQRRRPPSDFQIIRELRGSASPNHSPRRDVRDRKHARPRRTTSLNDDGLPVLETFPAHPPHRRRFLPRQEGSRQLGVRPQNDLFFASNQTNTAPSPRSTAATQVDSLAKVASSKLMPVRRCLDLSSTKPELFNDVDPPTVQKAIKDTLLTRVKHKMVQSVNSPRRSKSPVATRNATSDTLIQENS